MLYSRSRLYSNELTRHFWRLVSALSASADESLRYSRGNLTAIGTVGVIGHPVYYLVWQELFPQDYENLPLRLLSSLVCLPLVLVRYWPPRAERWLPLYFWFAVTYNLAFFFQFMLLQNGELSFATGELPYTWQMSNVMALVMLVMLVNDGALLALTFVLGSACAWALFLTTNDAIHFEAVQSGYLAPMPVYLFILIGGSIYNHHRETVQQEMLRAVSAVGSNIAHELRTPLLGIKSDARGMNRYLPYLLDGYEKARQAGLDVRPIRSSRFDALRDALERIEKETDFANTIIDMLLINSSGTGVVSSEIRRHSVSTCIEQALTRYPFATERELALVHFEKEPDFDFDGSDILLTHVVFNLLKNALYYIAQSGKGEIFIWLEANAVGGNRMFFMDTGQGIPPSQLPRIFDRFFSSMETGRGSGIGLSFCRMVMEGLDGSIECQSVHGEFTRFVLTFPGVSEHE